MAKTVSATQAKAQLSALMAEAAYGGERIIIERRGKPMAAIVSVEDLKQLEHDKSTKNWPYDVINSLSGWHEVGDNEIDEMIADIYASRKRDMGRPVELED